MVLSPFMQLRRALCTSALRSVSKATLVGRLGSVPKVQVWENERRTLALSLATNYTVPDTFGSYTTQTQWHKVFVRDDSVGFDYIARLKTGSLLYVEGDLRVVQRPTADGMGRQQFVNVSVSRRDGGTIRVLYNRGDTAEEDEDGEDEEEEEEEDDGVPF